jgi:hypothetical protein
VCIYIYVFKQRPPCELKFNSEQRTAHAENSGQGKKILAQSATEILCKKRMARLSLSRYFETREFPLFAYPPTINIQFFLRIGITILFIGAVRSQCFYFETVGRPEMRKAKKQVARASGEEHRVSPTVDLLCVFGLVRTLLCSAQHIAAARRARSPTHSLLS